jgi:hypothetical protein
VWTNPPSQCAALFHRIAVIRVVYLKAPMSASCISGPARGRRYCRNRTKRPTLCIAIAGARFGPEPIGQRLLGHEGPLGPHDAPDDEHDHEQKNELRQLK